jgi:hypothetical protein
MQAPQLNQADLDPQTRNFYCQTLGLLNKARMPFLICGAYALERYTGIARHTKDLDLFIRPRDCQRILDLLAQAGLETEMAVPHWLAKATYGENFIDLIFRSANGYCEVDDAWFENAVADEVLGIPVQVCAPEDMIWSKAFVMARDRFDGADVAHLLLACGDCMNWARLLKNFGPHWRVLFSHLILFGFIYPEERSRIPDWVMNDLSQRLQQELNSPPPVANICRGPLLAPLQYLIDIEKWGYQDARLQPIGQLTPRNVEEWINHLHQEANSH